MRFPDAMWTNKRQILVSMNCRKRWKILQVLDTLTVDSPKVEISKGFRDFQRKTT